MFVNKGDLPWILISHPAHQVPCKHFFTDRIVSIAMSAWHLGFINRGTIFRNFNKTASSAAPQIPLRRRMLDRSQDCCDFGIDSQTLYSKHSRLDIIHTRQELIHTRQDLIHNSARSHPQAFMDGGQWFYSAHSMNTNYFHPETALSVNFKLLTNLVRGISKKLKVILILNFKNKTEANR